MNVLGARKWIVSSLAAALLSAAATWAPAALGAEVNVSETPGSTSQANLTFDAATGEANAVTIRVAGEAGELFELEVVDAGAALTAGAGCSGGGSPGTPAICSIHRPRNGETVTCGRFCLELVPGTRWIDTITATLDDESDSFDAATLSSSVEGESLKMIVGGGEGADQILTGSGNDLVEPGLGDDEVRTAEGRDRVEMEPVADGNDVIDLGGNTEDEIDYSARTEPLRLDQTTVEADGATDQVTGFRILVAGSGDDVLLAPPFYVQLGGRAGNDLLVGNETAGSWLYGGPGEDVIRGGPEANLIEGGSGDDIVYGEAGDDRIFEDGSGANFPNHSAQREAPSDGNDIAYGGPGNDYIRIGTGADRVEGGDGDDIAYGEAGDDVVSGGSGDDKLAGGGGSNELWGGPGADRIFAAADGNPYGNGNASLGNIVFWADRVNCGGDSDFAVVNRWDEVTGCERTVTERILRQKGAIERGRLTLYGTIGNGHLVVFGPGVEKRVADFDNDPPAVSHTVEVRIRPRVLRGLARNGSAAIRLRVRFSPAGEPRRAEGQVVRIRRTLHKKHRHHSRRPGAS